MADTFDINELHWLLDIVQSIDVGVVVLDRDYNVEVWNSFMENHSGVSAEQASRHSLFELFPEIDQSWFTHKVETAVMLGTRAFTIWEQRPNLVHFKSYQPITGLADEMYQNVTILPLRSATGKTDHVCLIIYDVTGVAVNKRQLESANTKLQELALRDGLTGLLNRRYWESCLEREFARHQRYDSPVSLVIFDIDHFKRVNDTYGHQTGDEVIRSVAESLPGWPANRLRRTLRRRGVCRPVARHSGGGRRSGRRENPRGDSENSFPGLRSGTSSDRQYRCLQLRARPGGRYQSVVCLRR